MKKFVDWCKEWGLYLLGAAALIIGVVFRSKSFENTAENLDEEKEVQLRNRKEQKAQSIEESAQKVDAAEEALRAIEEQPSAPKADSEEEFVDAWNKDRNT